MSVIEENMVDFALKHQTWQLRVNLVMLKALGSGVRATKHPLCCRMRARMEKSLAKWSSIPFPDRQGLCPAMNILVKDVSLKIQHVMICKL